MTNPNPSPVGIGFGFVLFGADNRNRTCMKLPSLEPESSASASSAISAYLVEILYFYTARTAEVELTFS